MVALDQQGHAFSRDKEVDLTLYRLMQEPDQLIRPQRRMLSLSTMLGLYHECSWCGEQPAIVLDDGEVPVVRATTPCASPDGITTVFELRVPSGRIVLDDDLRDVYNISEEQDNELNINTALGCHQTSIAFAALGCAHGFVGNSCPGFYKVSDGQYVIANPGSRDDDTDIPVEGQQLATTGNVPVHAS